ncbi:MAG TPA: septum formation initiator family protein [Acidimicrobiales bacterium]|jgi:cell division protein FtsB|nr:septum formation initiator family protein [Acidimicrobiales bacterium]
MAPSTTPSRKERHHSRDVRRTRLILIGGTVLSAVILVAWFPVSSLYHQHAALASASEQLAQLHHEDAALAQERAKLSDSSEIGRIARQQYQLVSPGQQAFAVLPPTGAATTGTPYAGDPGLSTPSAPSGTSELAPAAGATHKTTAPPSTLDRMVRALEFWR